MMNLENEELIKKWEALKLKSYLPTPHDVWTIGWGHTKGVRPNQTITRLQAQKFFEQDVAWAEEAVNKLVKVPINQNQFDALTSLMFNIGEANFKKSTLLRKLNRKDYQGAAEQFMVWVKQRQNGKLVTLRGLVRRRAEEMDYFLKPAPMPSKTVSVDNKPWWKKIFRWR